MDISQNPVLTALKERRSVRRYASRQITDEELHAVLEAGIYAPTSMGRQDPWIVAVQNPAQVARLAQLNAAVLGTSSNPYYGAPTIVLVFASDSSDRPNAPLDAALVLGNMMNAAQALGLGSCWIHREKEIFSSREGKEMMRQWNLPEGLMGVGALALGYPAGDVSPAKPRKADYYRIVK